MNFTGRIHTGPCAVSQLAQKLRNSGVRVTVEGTEHVWIEVEAPDYEKVGSTVATLVEKVHGRRVGNWACRVTDIRRVQQ